MNRHGDLGDLLIQQRSPTVSLAQLRGTMKQKELVGLLVSTGGTYAEIASVLDTSEAVVEVTARALRNQKKGSGPRRPAAEQLKRGNSMAEKPSAAEEQVELLKKILIVQLGLAGVSQRVVRKIVGGDIVRVNQIMKHLPKKVS